MPPQEKKHGLNLACLPKIKSNKYPLRFTFLLLQSNLQGSRAQIHEGTSEFSFLGPHGFCNCQIVRIHNSIKYKQHLLQTESNLVQDSKTGFGENVKFKSG